MFPIIPLSNDRPATPQIPPARIVPVVLSPYVPSVAQTPARMSISFLAPPVEEIVEDAADEAVDDSIEIVDEITDVPPQLLVAGPEEDGLWGGQMAERFFLVAWQLKPDPRYNNGEGKYKTTFWTKMSSILLDRWRVVRTKEQCSNRNSYMSSKWKDRQYHLAQSGFGVDAEGKITCSDATWRDFVGPNNGVSIRSIPFQAECNTNWDTAD